MPKVLSLKKVHKTCQLKNQKPITQFFKNTTNVDAQKTPNSPGQRKCTEKANKRKALSPVPIDTIDLLDEPYLSSETKLSNGVCKNTPKKPKTANYNMPTASSLCKPVQKSPKKENGLSTQEQREVTDHKICSEKEKIRFFKITTDISIDRSPLSSVAFDNVNTINKSVNNVKLCLFENENHAENIEVSVRTPVKCSPHRNHDHKKRNSTEKKRNKTPKKSPIQDFHSSPISKSIKPEKTLKDIRSPSKSGSTVRVLDFTQNDVGDMFGEEWEVDDFDEDFTEDLDLSTMQRCEILSVKLHSTRLELKLKNVNNNTASCFVDGIWLDTALSAGDIVSVTATRDSSGRYSVRNDSGLLVLRPDHLVSSTSVVAGVFCRRKAVLQERWRGIDSANTAMTIGILIHELVQKALTDNIMELSKLRSESERIIKESIQMLYDAGLTQEEARSNMQSYLQPLSDFMQTYVGGRSSNLKAQRDKENWRGQIDKVLDIEENLCCPQLGLKGKIDATLQVTIHDKNGSKRAVVPLELKSGKASMSAEHRGQVVLYGMMLSLLREEDPATALQRGLLLYLRDSIDVREVSCGYPERRDLLMLRNQLVQYLAKGPEEVDSEQLIDIEDASILLQQRLPDPINHENACTKCPYLTVCSLHLWHTDGPSVSQNHPLSKLRDQALGHLLPDHIKYFLHWAALFKMEERGQMNASPLHALWTETVEKRVKRGTCAANLRLKNVEPSGDRYIHVFVCQDANGAKATKGPQEGEFSIVSILNRPWIAAGVVIFAKNQEISILLERDLSRRLGEDTIFHIDTYESYATTVQNLTNLGVLMEDSGRAERLRKLIIDKATPEFDNKLPREVGRLGTKLMRSLNIEQQRAVLKALAAKDYALLQGLPGTGKTQTISVLIQMLVGLKQRVLVTAHTHSAVDTVLSRLPESTRVMRLGSAARVSASIQKRCEQTLAASCETPEELAQLYDSMDVVGVTCLGAAHAMLARTTFDVCIVDEATQVLQCTVLRPLFAAKRFVLVGDPEQLPPVVRSRAARRLGMEDSLFHRLMSEDATTTLQLQYRMNQPLADLANRVAYHNRLKCADRRVSDAFLDIDVQKISDRCAWLLKACGPEPESAALFLDLASTDNVTDNQIVNNKTCTNVEEVCVVIALVNALKEGGIQASDIGVIAPYRDQVSLLRRSLASHSVEVSTVDQFQGRDKPVIIYSCTKRDGHEDRKVKEGEVLNDQRRLAVSVTRAKHKLLVVGSSFALRRYAPLQRLIEACTPLQLDKNTVKSLCDKYRTIVEK